MVLNRQQIEFKLAMDYLSIPVDIENYATLFDAYSMGRRKRIPEFCFDFGFDDVVKLQTEWDSSFTDFSSWKLDEKTKKVLDELKKDLSLKSVLSIID